MNPILVDLGIVQIHWYSTFIFLGLLFGGILIIKEGRKFKIPDDFFVNLIFWLVPISLVGARLYYVIFNWSYFSNDLFSIIRIWEGGLAIHGGVIFGLIFLLLYCKKHRINSLLVTDISVVGLILGQAIGRWGNFFNSEAFGGEVTRSFLEKFHIPSFVIEGMNIGGVYHHPTFLYESVWNIIGLIIMLVLRKTRYVKKGQLTAFYFMWYSFGRFFIESLRMDSLYLGEFRVAQLISILLFVIGLIMFVVFGKGSRFNNRYKEEGGSTLGTSEIVYWCSSYRVRC